MGQDDRLWRELRLGRMLDADSENPMCISPSTPRSEFDHCPHAAPGCSEGGPSERCVCAPAHLALVAKGLAHPTRVAILSLIATNEDRRTTGEIVAETGLAQSTISEHLRILREAGLVAAHRDGPRICYTVERHVLRRFAGALNQLAPDPEP